MRHLITHIPVLVMLTLLLVSTGALGVEGSAGLDEESAGKEDVSGDETSQEAEAGEGVEGPEPTPALFTTGTSVSEPEAEASGEEGTVGVDLPKASAQVIQRGDVLFSGMGPAGLAVIDVSDPESPVILKTLSLGLPVKALQIMDDTLLVILDDFSVVPMDITDPRNPVPPAGAPAGMPVVQAPPAEPPPPPIEGKVAKIDKGWVVIDVGTEDGVKAGMRFAIYGKESSSQPRAIVVIAKASKKLCTGPLPPRGDASKGDRAVRTDSTWRMRYWFSPLPSPGYFKMSLDFKPIIGANKGAGTWGFLADLELSYKFKAPAEIALVMMPVGYGSSDVGKGAVFEFGAMGGINWRYIGYTWGVGAHLSVAMEDRFVLLLNRLRLGNLDGFHLEFFFTWIVPTKEEDGMRRVFPDTATFTVDVPLRPRLNLYFILGGGNLATIDDDEEGSGWANFILGVRSFLKGAGGSGSLVLSTGLGLGYVWDQSPDDAIDQVGGSAWGPMLHLGLDWRL